jgi:predicted  nucleic acid-binding Zn-ribbon protein
LEEEITMLNKLKRLIRSAVVLSRQEILEEIVECQQDLIARYISNERVYAGALDDYKTLVKQYEEQEDDLKSEIVSLQMAIEELENDKVELENQIDDIRESYFGYDRF